MKTRILSTARLSFPLASAIAALLTATSVQAASYYWDTDAAAAGAGGATPSEAWTTGGLTWSTSPDGTAATPAVTSALTDDLFFSAGINATGAYAITLNDTQAAQSLTFQDGTATISGAGGVITLGGTGIINVTNSLLATPNTAVVGANTDTLISGSTGLTKVGVGTLTLNGTAVNTFTGGLNVNGGTLGLNFANLVTPTDLINNGNDLALGGGNLLITGNGAGTTLQTLSNVTVNSGGGSILVNPNGGTDTNITLGSLASAASGGSLIVGRATGSGAGDLFITTTTDKDATGIYGGRVVFADGTASTGYDWATTTDASSEPYTLSAYTGYTPLDTTTPGDVTDTANSRITAGATLPALSNRTTNSLKFENPAASQTFAIGAGNTLTLTSGGLLMTGSANDMDITGGSITAGDGSGPADLVVQQFNPAQPLAVGLTGIIDNTPEISSNIVNNGSAAVTLVKNGPGSVRILGTANTFTGGVIVNQGSVDFGNLSLNNNPITFNANAFFYTNGVQTTTGSITLNNGSQVTICNNNSSFTVNANVVGSGGLSAANGGQGAMTLNLNGTANTFTGPVRFAHSNGTQQCTINVASLPDTDTLGTGNITFGTGTVSSTSQNFGLASTAVAPLTLTNRRFEMAGDNVNQQINNASSQALTIQSDLLVTGSRAKNLQLGGAGAGSNTFAGVIANHPSPTAPGTVPNAERKTANGTTLTLGSVEGIAVGATITGTFIPASTTITAINPVTRVVTLSQGYTAANNSNFNVGVLYTIPDVVNSVSVTKTGTSTWVLSGNNSTYTGPTLISAGILEVKKLADTGADSSIGRGSATTSNVGFGSGATLRYTGSAASSTNRALTYTANANDTGFVLDASGTGTGTVEFSNTAAITNTTNNQGRHFTLTGNNTGNNTLAAQVNNNGTSTANTNIIKTGTGKWVLTNANSAYTGAVFINNGTLSTNSIKDSGTASPIGAGLRFTLGNTNDNGILEYTGSGDTSNRETRIGTPSTLQGTGGGSILNNGGGALIFNATTFNISQTGITNTRTLTLGGSYTSAANEIQGVIQDNTAATGLVNLEKTGDGTWKLSGTNTYTGATTISAGTLLVNSPGSLHASTAVAVNGGTLGGTGTINGAVTVAAGGSVAPGASAGLLTAGSLDLSAMANGGTGKLVFELGADTASSDRIAVTGSLTIGVDVLGFSDFTFSNLGGLAAGTYKLITSGAPVGGSLDPANLSGSLGGTFTGTLQISDSGAGNDIELVVTSSGANYASWIAGFYTGVTDPLIIGPGADPDKDGMSNLVEYALGKDPKVSSQPAGVLSGNKITFTKGAEAIANGDVSWVIETSTDLGLTDDWTPAVTQPAGDPALTISHTFTPSTPVKDFARLKVTQVP